MRIKRRACFGLDQVAERRNISARMVRTKKPGSESESAKTNPVLRSRRRKLPRDDGRERAVHIEHTIEHTVP